MRSEGFPFIVWGFGGWTLVCLQLLVASSSRRRGIVNSVSMGEAAKPLLFECFQAGCHVVLRGKRGTFLTPHSTLYTLHFALHTPHSTHHPLHFPLQTPHSTLYAPHSTLYTPHFTLHTPHFTLLTPHFTLHTCLLYTSDAADE